MNATDIARRCLRGDLTEVQFNYLCSTHDVDPEQVKELVDERLMIENAGKGMLPIVVVLLILLLAVLMWLVPTTP